MRSRGRRAIAQLSPARRAILDHRLYADRCSFQRCADEAGANASGERYFATLQELYAAPQIDGRSLKELWSEADEFYCFDFEL